MTYDPAAIPGLAARWRAADITGLVDGDPVASWTDSVAGIVASQATASAQPTYAAVGLGGKPAVQFDGTDDSLVSGQISESNYTVAVVVQLNTSSIGYRTILNQTCTSGSWSLRSYSGNNTGIQFLFNSGLGSSVDKTKPHLVVGEAPSQVGWVDGTSNWSGSSQSFTLDGGTLAVGDGSWSGTVAEILVYSRYLTATERGQLDSYVQDFYGITVSDYVPSGGAAQTVAPNGITSTLAVGTPTVAPGAVVVAPNGITSTLTVGAPTVASAPVTVAPDGIASTTTVGAPAIVPGSTTVAPDGIGSTAALGAPVLVPGPVIIGPDGVTSTLVVGVPDLTTGVTITPDSISPTLVVGAPDLTVGAVTLAPLTIAATLTAGQPGVLPAPAAIGPDGIGATLAVGVPGVQALGQLIPRGPAYAVLTADRQTTALITAVRQTHAAIQ